MELRGQLIMARRGGTNVDVSVVLVADAVTAALIISSKSTVIPIAAVIMLTMAVRQEKDMVPGAEGEGNRRRRSRAFMLTLFTPVPFDDMGQAYVASANNIACAKCPRY